MRLVFCFSRSCRPEPTTLALRALPCWPGPNLRFSTGPLSVKHLGPFRKSFMPSRRQRRQTGPLYRANLFLLVVQVTIGLQAGGPSVPIHKKRFEISNLKFEILNQTLRRFGGLHPLCGIGVTSRIERTSMPAAARARMADSRPEPGPLTRTSMLLMPCSRAWLAAFCAACWAANGVPLRDPRKPSEPELFHDTVRPSPSVMVTMVLFNEAWIYAIPCGTFLRSFFLKTFFLPLALVAPAAAGFAIIFLFPLIQGLALLKICAHRPPSLAFARDFASGLPLGFRLAHARKTALRLRGGLLLVGHRALARALAGARIGVRALAADRQAAAMTEAAIRADFDQPLDMHRDIFAQIAFHVAFVLNDLADPVDLFFVQVLDLLQRFNLGRGQNRLRTRVADAVDVSQRDIHMLVAGKIDARNSCHDACLLNSLEQ